MHLASTTSDFIKSFLDDSKDILYCHLNEIEPDFESNVSSDEEYFKEYYSVDPRNNLPVYANIINLALSDIYYETQKFSRFPIKSLLSEQEQLLYLKRLRNEDNQNFKFVKNFHSRLSRECKLFSNFVKSYITANPFYHESICKRLNNLFNDYLKKKIINLKNEPRISYVVQSALPFYINTPTKNCYSVQNSEIVLKMGYVPRYDIKANKCFTNLFHNQISNCMINGVKNLNKPLITNANIVLPDEVLEIFLCSSLGDYDQWEIPFTIQRCEENLNMGTNITEKIIFDYPFPIRTPSLTYYRKLIELKLQEENQKTCHDWYFMNNNSDESNFIKNKIDEEIFAVDLQREFKPYKFKEYTKINNKFESFDEKDHLKNNSVFVNWNICELINKEISLNFLTQTKLDSWNFIPESDEINFINLSIKPQYKSEFGSEVMTINELIHEWIKSILMPETELIRVHIDIKSSQVLFTEHISRKDIEANMFRLYKKKPEELLQTLVELLNLMKSFPTGNYLLKKEPNNTNRIVVYMEKSKCDTNYINILNLYDKYQEKPFWANSFPYLPIDDSKLTPNHVKHNIPPCCFPYWGSENKITMNDNIKIIKKVNKKQCQKEEKFKLNIKLREARRKAVKCIKRKKIKKQQKKSIINEDCLEYESSFNQDLDIPSEYHKTEILNVMPVCTTSYDLSKYLAEAFPEEEKMLSDS